jgi:hypothetical protein
MSSEYREPQPMRGFLPAQPGWYVLGYNPAGEEREEHQDPILAWAINEDNEPVPVTLDGPVEDARAAILSPLGDVRELRWRGLEGRWWPTREAWLHEERER